LQFSQDINRFIIIRDTSLHTVLPQPNI